MNQLSYTRIVKNVLYVFLFDDKSTVMLIQMQKGQNNRSKTYKNVVPRQNKRCLLKMTSIASSQLMIMILAGLMILYLHFATVKKLH